MSSAFNTAGVSDTDRVAKVLAAALPMAANDGFTDKVLKDGAAEAGIDADDVARLFPKGPLSLVEEFSLSADRDMKARLAELNLAEMKVRERIATAVKMRLSAIRPHKEAARRAAAFLTLPQNASVGVNLLWQTADGMWRTVGDTSTDFNFYTKRAILMGVYSSTLIRWFNDNSEDENPTSEFLKARIEGVMKFEKFKAEMNTAFSKIPSLTDLLGGIRPDRS